MQEGVSANADTGAALLPSSVGAPSLEFAASDESSRNEGWASTLDNAQARVTVQAHPFCDSPSLAEQHNPRESSNLLCPGFAVGPIVRSEHDSPEMPGSNAKVVRNSSLSVAGNQIAPYPYDMNTMSAESSGRTQVKFVPDIPPADGVDWRATSIRTSMVSSIYTALTSGTGQGNRRFETWKDGTSVYRPNEIKKTRVFMDATALKQQVIANLCKPQYHVHNMYHERGIVQMIARSQVFDNAALLVIALNALWIAIDTDYNDKTVLLEAHTVFQVVENLFCTFFFFEICVRFLAFKRKVRIFFDAWFTFDALMAALMVSETWIMTVVILLSSSGDGGYTFGNASLLRLLRLMRLTRIARMARLLRSLPELMILLKGMQSASRSVFFTLLLLVLNIYVFAIAFTQMTKDTEVGDTYFNGVFLSMYTLTVRGTLLDSPSTVAWALGEETPIFGLIFFLFILVAALTVMNMLIGVLCEVVSTVAAVEKEEMAVSMVKSRLHHIVAGIDENGDMEISRDEFIKIVGNKDASSHLSAVGVDVVGLIDFVDFIFEPSPEGKDKSLSFHEFMEVVLSLRGSNVATVKDIIDLRKYLHNMFNTANENLHKEVNKMTERMNGLDENHENLSKKTEDRQRKIERQLDRIERLLEKVAGVADPYLGGDSPRSPRGSPRERRIRSTQSPDSSTTMPDCSPRAMRIRSTQSPDAGTTKPHGSPRASRMPSTQSPDISVTGPDVSSTGPSPRSAALGNLSGLHHGVQARSTCNGGLSLAQAMEEMAPSTSPHIGSSTGLTESTEEREPASTAREASYLS